VLTYLLGPLLALFPRRWRKLLPAGSAVAWHRATVLSGFGEAVIALIALMSWYSYYMAVMVDHGLDAALTGRGRGGREIAHRIDILPLVNEGDFLLRLGTLCRLFDGFLLPRGVP
jgi:hypothetical protein